MSTQECTCTDSTKCERASKGELDNLIERLFQTMLKGKLQRQG